MSQPELPGSGPSDAELLRQAQAGNSDAFDILAGRHEAQLFRMAFFLTGHASDADDVVQETLMGAFGGLRQFQGRSSVKTWLMRILSRQAARHHRSKRVRLAAQPVQLSSASKALLGGASGPDLQRNAEIQMDVAAVLQSIDPEQREVIVLRELNGLSYQQIAEVLEIPEGTVDSRLYRARQELKVLLKDYLE
jgi:RNA polymerase sigma-70 factor (ECF subfamily)